MAARRAGLGWTLAPRDTNVVILRGADRSIVTARVQVLRVTHISCQEHARECRPSVIRAVSLSWALASHAMPRRAPKPARRAIRSSTSRRSLRARRHRPSGRLYRDTQWRASRHDTGAGARLRLREI